MFSLNIVLLEVTLYLKTSNNHFSFHSIPTGVVLQKKIVVVAVKNRMCHSERILVKYVWLVLYLSHGLGFCFPGSYTVIVSRTRCTLQQPDGFLLQTFTTYLLSSHVLLDPPHYDFHPFHSIEKKCLTLSVSTLQESILVFISYLCNQGFFLFMLAFYFLFLFPLSANPSIPSLIVNSFPSLHLAVNT